MTPEERIKALEDTFKIVVANLHHRINDLQQEVNDLKHNDMQVWDLEDVKANSGHY